MPGIKAQSLRATDLTNHLARNDCGFRPFPSDQTRQHLIDLIERDLLWKGNGSQITAPFKSGMINNGFRLVVNDSWRSQANQHPNRPTDRSTGLEFVALNKQIPPLKSEVSQVTKSEIEKSQKGVKIYCDLEAIRKIYPGYNDALFLQAISSMMRAKKGDNIGTEEQKVLQEISPHILLRFESKQIFEYYKDQNGQEEIKILDPIKDKRAQNRPFYFNYTPQLTKGAPDFQYFTYNNGPLDRNKRSQLKEKYQSMAKLQLYVSAKNNEGCFFLEPGAFLDGLSASDQVEAKKMWLEGVFDAITEFEKRPDKLGKGLGRVFVQSSFLPSDIQRDEKNIKHLQVYFSDDLDCAKTHANLGGGLPVAQPVMGHATHAIGNGGLSDRAGKAAEENLYRQMAGLMAVVMGPQNNKNLLDYNWLASRAEDISTGQSLSANLNSNPQNPTQRVARGSANNQSPVAMGRVGGNNSSQNPRGGGGAGVGRGVSRASAMSSMNSTTALGSGSVPVQPMAPALAQLAQQQNIASQSYAPTTSPQQPLSATGFNKNQCCVIS